MSAIFEAVQWAGGPDRVLAIGIVIALIFATAAAMISENLRHAWQGAIQAKPEMVYPRPAKPTPRSK